MADINHVANTNLLSEKTWDSKVKNIVRLLDDRGYGGTYVARHVGDKVFLDFPTKTFTIDLSSDTTERQVLHVIDDFFTASTRDRSYKQEGDPESY